MSSDAEEYRPVSWLAVAGAVAGVVSALALFGPFFWVLPLIGIVLAVAGLADVRREGAPRAGGWAALVGLFLAAGFGAQAVAGYTVHRVIARQRAAATARHWVTTVQGGNITDAAKMIGPAAIDRGLAVPGSSEETAEQLLDRHPTVLAIRRCGGGAAVTATTEGTVPEDPTLWITSVTMTPCDGGGAYAIKMLVQPHAVVRQGRTFDTWHVIRLPDVRSSSPPAP